MSYSTVGIQTEESRIKAAVSWLVGVGEIIGYVNVSTGQDQCFEDISGGYESFAERIDVIRDYCHNCSSFCESRGVT
jgi:hypothetical protein